MTSPPLPPSPPSGPPLGLRFLAPQVCRASAAFTRASEDLYIVNEVGICSSV
ncbi:MAG: hypothetical protein MZV63_52000 [Marinilabiliales bacterium]|nr:hypothetical protein [Marinilabiliales bacterium]